MNSWEVLGTVVGEVPVDLPVLAPVQRLLDVHGGGPEGLEGDDDVGDVELRLEVQLDRHVLVPVTCLPPSHLLLVPRTLVPFLALGTFLLVYDVGHVVLPLLVGLVAVVAFLLDLVAAPAPVGVGVQ